MEDRGGRETGERTARADHCGPGRKTEDQRGRCCVGREEYRWGRGKMWVLLPGIKLEAERVREREGGRGREGRGEDLASLIERL